MTKKATRQTWTISWWSRLMDLIAPRQCSVCGRRLAVSERTLCSACLLHLPRTGYQLTPDNNPMVQLFWKHTPIRRAAALMFYEPHSEVARVVYDMKYHQRPDIGEDMGRLMGNELQLAGFFDDADLLVPVPLAPKRQRQRGYNQSERLASGISEVTGVPVCSTALRRRLFRMSQTHTINRQERRQNVADMFEVVDAKALEGKHIVLVDDICTTGATLTACADSLHDIAGLRISVVTLGLTKV